MKLKLIGGLALLVTGFVAGQFFKIPWFGEANGVVNRPNPTELLSSATVIGMTDEEPYVPAPWTQSEPQPTRLALSLPDDLDDEDESQAPEPETSSVPAPGTLGAPDSENASP